MPQVGLSMGRAWPELGLSINLGGPPRRCLIPALNGPDLYPIPTLAGLGWTPGLKDKLNIKLHAQIQFQTKSHSSLHAQASMDPTFNSNLDKYSSHLI